MLNRYNPHQPNTKGYHAYFNKIVRSFWTSLFDYTCQLCGLQNDTRNMCFHHRSSEDKVDNVGSLMRLGDKSKHKLIEELLKCDYLCENCHYKVHAKMGDLDEDFKTIVGRRYSHVQNMLGSPD